MRKFLSLVLALVMMMSLITINTGAVEFTDSDDITYQEAVDVISAIHVVDGYSGGDFQPAGNLTRGAAAKIICNLILGPTTAAQLKADTAPFRDVPVNHDFAGYIAYCQKEGIISGYGDGNFRPAGTLTGNAFMKMLLGALGYDAEIEQYVGPNWSINVAKRAIGIGLDKGLEEAFDGTKFITREEAALYSLNTLQADLVEYAQKITASVNGVEVNVGNSQATSRKWDSQKTKNDNIIPDDGLVQFAEEYFNKLVLTHDVDAFGRPDREWDYDGDNIGAYLNTDLLKQEWTVEVTGKDLYDLLGSNAIDHYDFTITIDGLEIDSNKTVLTDDARSYFDEDFMTRNYKSGVGQTGKGVLTQVFVEPGVGNTGKVWVAVINTFLAQATGDYSEKKDEIKFDVFALDKTGDSYYKYRDANNFAWKNPGKDSEVLTVSGEDFPEITEMKKDDIVLVNVADGNIEIISEPEVLENTTLTAFSWGNYVEADSDKYDYGTTVEYDVDTLDQYTGVSSTQQLKDIEYNVYLDPYGYLIGIKAVEKVNNYIFLTGIDQGASNLNNKTADAAGILLDGTFINFQMNMTDSRAQVDGDGKTINPAGFRVETPASASDTSGNKFQGHALWNTWCTYTVDKNNVYTLKEVGDFTGTQGVKPAKAGQYHDLASNDKEINSKRVSLLGDTGKYVYGNDDSIYILADLEEVVLKNDIQKAFPVAGDAAAAALGSKLNAASSHKAGIINGVDSIGTGIDNISMTTYADVATLKSTKDITSDAFPGWIYTLFDKDGYVIAAIVVGEDDGTTKNLVYSHKDDVESERYSSADDEWTWTRYVIYNGEEILLTEKGDGLSKLDDMDQNVWYEVTYKADGTIKSVQNAYYDEDGKSLGGKAAASDPALTRTAIATAESAIKNENFVDNIHNLEKTVANSSKSTVLYEEVWGLGQDEEGAVTSTKPANSESTAKSTALDEDNQPSLKGSTLYVNTTAKEGFYVSKDVKSVLIQKNDGKSTTSYGEGTTDLENFLDDLNFDDTDSTTDKPADHSYLFKISAVLVDGRATVVIIHDWNEGDVVKNDGTHDGKGEDEGNEGDVEIYVNFYTDVDNKAGHQGTEQVIYKAASSTGRLVLELSDITLPTGFEVDSSKTLLPMSLTVQGTGSGYAEADVQVKLKTKNLKLPEDYVINYTSTLDGGKTDYSITNDDATNGIAIPEGITVTVKVAGTGSDGFYILNPVAAADAADTVKYLKEDGTFQVVMSADRNYSTLNANANKYYKVTGTANSPVTKDNIAYTVAGLTAYVKAGGTASTTLSGTGTATAGNGTGTIGVTGTTNSATVNVTSGATLTGPATDAGYTDSTVVITLATAPSGDSDTAFTFTIT